MKKIAFFCIPAHGHTNPMLPVAAALVRRGNRVRFYSFDMFAEKIKATGAEFVSCDRFLLELTEKEEAGMKRVSTTEMTIQDIRFTINTDAFIDREFESFQPDVVYTDSVCFWGKLNAWKHRVPMVVSTSTFAFNRMSSQYMKNSPREIFDMVTGLPRLSKELKKLEPYGYCIKNPLTLVQSDNSTDSVVYASPLFQPFSESFSKHYAFVGPSVFSDKQPDKSAARPLVYISMGTVINDRPDFYKTCIAALKDMPVEVIISCGSAVDRDSLGTLPENIQVFPYVNQLDVLSRASVFITHCGMNSVSESLYMAAPLVLFPQTNGQKAVARRVGELNAGVMLKDASEDGIRDAVSEILDNPAYADAARRCREDFRACGGAERAAEFIESAPHSDDGVDVFKELDRFTSRFNLIYWIVYAAAMLLIRSRYSWLLLPFAIALNIWLGAKVSNLRYTSLVKKIKKE